MSLAADILPNIRAIAQHIYGEVSPSTERRVRHLIAKNVIPAKKLGGRIESRRSWIDEVYAAPDHVNGRAGK
jgi:hypothetical protein